MSESSGMVLHQGTEIVVENVELGVVQGSTPKAMIASAVEAANELAAIITSRSLFSNIQGKRYVKCEGWTTLAAIMGCLPREVEVTEKDGTYVAVVELHRIRDDALMGRASAECGMAEPTWKSRAPYARRSMAVTRATSKACRIAFSWVMTLAGFEVTPAEEMPSGETVARGAGSLPYLANGVTTPPAQASEKEGASPAPSPKGGFDLVKKEKLSQKNIDLLLKKAAPRFGTGADTGLLICVFEATGIRPASLKSSDWPAIDVQQYDKILEAIRAPEMPDAVQIEEMETELLARLKDQTLKPKVRVAVLAEYENKRDRDELTVELLQEWLGSLAFAKQD